MPEVGLWSHLPLLQDFQALVELQESARIIVDLSAPAGNHQYSDLKVQCTLFWILLQMSTWSMHFLSIYSVVLVCPFRLAHMYGLH